MGLRYKYISCYVKNVQKMHGISGKLATRNVTLVFPKFRAFSVHFLRNMIYICIVIVPRMALFTRPVVDSKFNDTPVFFISLSVYPKSFKQEYPIRLDCAPVSNRAVYSCVEVPKVRNTRGQSQQDPS